MDLINFLIMTADYKDLPKYTQNPPRIVIDIKHYKKMIHWAYKAKKAQRKAKARKKRINSRCGR